MIDRRAKSLAFTSGLLQVSSVWRRMAEKALVEEGVSAARASALVWIGRLGNGTRQVTLAANLGVTGTSLVRLLDELCASGLVERRDVAEDRRAKALWLTAEGEDVTRRVEDMLADLRDSVFGDISDADFDAALRVFEAIARANL